jgi:hypothetical protein
MATQFRRGDALIIEPEKSLCARNEPNTDNRKWRAVVAENEMFGAYMLDFDDTTCPPSESVDGIPMTYWLTARGTRWFVSASYSHAPQTFLAQIAVRSVVQESKAADDLSYRVEPLRMVGGTKFVAGRRDYPVETDAMGNALAEQQLAADEINAATVGIVPPLSIKSIMEHDDTRAMQQIIRQELSGKFKPQMVRTVLGGRAHGLGIRNPPETEFRKEWLTLPRGSMVNVRVDITDADDKPLTQTVLRGKIIGVYEKSAVLNSLGVVYELDIEKAIGDEIDIETFTPVFVDRRKIKYWLCVFYDLEDTKIVATSSLVTYAEFAQDMSPGGNENLRLGEYGVGEVKLVGANGEVLPYKGDKEDVESKELYKSAQSAKAGVRAMAEAEEAVADTTEAPLVEETETVPEAEQQQPVEPVEPIQEEEAGTKKRRKAKRVFRPRIRMGGAVPDTTVEQSAMDAANLPPETNATAEELNTDNEDVPKRGRRKVFRGKNVRANADDAGAGNEDRHKRIEEMLRRLE